MDLERSVLRPRAKVSAWRKAGIAATEPKDAGGVDADSHWPPWTLVLPLYGPLHEPEMQPMHS